MPAFTGTRVVEPDLATLVRFVDWQFFFHAWELKGKYPAILEQPAARELFDDAQALLTQIVEGKLLQPKGAYGFWPASSDGDDILLEDGTRLAMLRQQSAYGDARPNRSLADYVAPENDYLGGFAVAIHGADELAAAYEAEHDDYHAIMVKALADRFAEAFAEYLHQQARRDWYETGTELSSEDLIAERFRGSASPTATPRAPTTRRSGRCSPCRWPRSVSTSPRPARWCRRPRSAGSTSHTRRPATSPSAGSGATRSRTTPPEREFPSRRRNGGSDPTLRTTRRQISPSRSRRAGFARPARERPWKP